MIRVLMCGPLEVSGGVSTHTKKLSKYLVKLGVELELYNLSGKNLYDSKATPWRKMYQRTMGLFLQAKKKKNNYDILHIQASGGMLSFISAINGSLIARHLKKKLVVTFHYSRSEQFIKQYKVLFAIPFSVASSFIVVSEKQKYLCDLYFKEDCKKVIMIPNGFESAMFKPLNMEFCRKKLGIPKDKKVLISIGNLMEYKGHKYLIEAIKIIIDSQKDILCLIIGDGNLKAKLNKKIKDYALEDYIKLIGKRPHDEIPLWMNSCDIFVLPSLAEGNPTVMFECLACGKPFVGTNVGGIPEIITSDEYGLLCEPANPKDLAEKILIALEKVWDREKIIKYAEQFTWEKIAQKVMEVYEKVLRIK